MLVRSLSVSRIHPEAPISVCIQDMSILSVLCIQDLSILGVVCIQDILGVVCIQDVHIRCCMHPGYVHIRCYNLGQGRTICHGQTIFWFKKWGGDICKKKVMRKH